MRRQFAGRVQLAEQGVQAEVDALDDDHRRREVGRLHDLGVRAGQVEEAAHGLDAYSGVSSIDPSSMHELVEVAEVVLEHLVGRPRSRPGEDADVARGCRGSAARSWSITIAWIIVLEDLRPRPA